MIKIHTYFWDLSCEEKERFHLPRQFNKSFQGEKVINVPMHVRDMNAKGDVVCKQLAQETQDENEDFQLQDNVQEAPTLIANSQGTQMLGFVNLSKDSKPFPKFNYKLIIHLTFTSGNPVHNAPVPPPPPLLTSDRKQPLLLHSCTVVVNAPRSCWPDVIPKKKDKKRSKYVALDFFAHFLFFIFYFVSSFLLI